MDNLNFRESKIVFNLIPKTKPENKAKTEV